MGGWRFGSVYSRLGHCRKVVKFTPPAAISGKRRCCSVIRTSVTANNNIFCDVTPCSLVKYRQKRFHFPSSTCEKGRGSSSKISCQQTTRRLITGCSNILQLCSVLMESTSVEFHWTVATKTHLFLDVI